MSDDLTTRLRAMARDAIYDAQGGQLEDRVHAALLAAVRLGMEEAIRIARRADVELAIRAAMPEEVQ